MKRKAKIKLYTSLVLVACILWAIAGTLMTRFVLEFMAHPKLLDMDSINKNILSKSLELQSGRFVLGGIVVLCILPIYCLYLKIIRYISKELESRYIRTAYFLFIVSFTMTAIGHMAFFYLGTMYNFIYQTQNFDLAPVIDLVNIFTKILLIVSIPAIIISFIAWVLLGAGIIRNNTILPKDYALISPVTIVPVMIFILSVLPGGDWYIISGVPMALASAVFWAVVLQYLIKNDKEK